MERTQSKSKAAAANKATDQSGTGWFDVLGAQRAAIADAQTRSKPAVAAGTPEVAKAPEKLRGGPLLLKNFEQANALSSAKAVESATVTVPLYLRMVEWNGGYLIGLVDDRKSTYAECEFFEDRALADTAWKEWIVACSVA